MNIKELQKEIHENAVNKGFWDKEHNFGNDIMLIVTELAECVEAHRLGEHANLEGFDNGTEDFTTEFKKHIKDTIEDELADAFIRLLDTAEGWGIDLQEHVKLKMLYNAKRERLHGKKY